MERPLEDFDHYQLTWRFASVSYTVLTKFCWDLEELQ